MCTGGPEGLQLNPRKLTAATGNSRMVDLGLLIWKIVVCKLNIFVLIPELCISLFLIK
jgi:hypothetical protein